MQSKNPKAYQTEGRKPKVALMSYTMDNRPGMGTALYARKLIEEFLADDRFEWHLVHYDRVDDPLYAKAHEILIPELPRFPVGTRFLRTMLFFWKYRKKKFDIIHWFQPRLYPFFWFAPAKKIVVTAYSAGDMSLEQPFSFANWVFTRMMKYFNRYISAVIAACEFGKREIEEWYKVPSEKVFVTYLGGGERFVPISLEEARATVARKYGLVQPFVLDVSRLEPHKNVATLIRAYAIARKANIVHKLVIAGRPSGGYEEMSALARSLGVSEDVVFTKYVDDDGLRALYAAADLFVFPSLSEGFGLPLVEAMSMGTPVLTSNVTSMPEIIGDAGVAVDPLDTDALAREMLRLLSDTALRKELAARGISRAREFTWKRTARDTLRLYAALLDTPIRD